MSIKLVIEVTKLEMTALLTNKKEVGFQFVSVVVYIQITSYEFSSCLKDRIFEKNV